MDDTEKRVHKYIEKHDLIRSDDKLLVAVSGGPDSLALLHFFMEFKFSPQRSNFRRAFKSPIKRECSKRTTRRRNFLREAGHSFLHRRSRHKKSSPKLAERP